MGVKWVRLDFTWAAIEPTKGSFSWSFYDSVVAAANSVGTKILAILDYSVGWANGGQSQSYPPINYQDYADFCAAVVARYAPLGVKYYEIWNEPNTSGFWQPHPDPIAYTGLLQAAYVSIKSVDSTVSVLFGGLSDNPINDIDHIPADTFLQNAYNAGAQGYFDHFSYHPYSWNVTQLNSLRSSMVSNGDSNKDMWFTEYGDTTFGAVGQFYVTEQQQAIELTNTLQIVGTLSYAGPIFIYEYQDSQLYTDTNPDREGYFGLVRKDGTKKPSYYAVRDVIREFYT